MKVRFVPLAIGLSIGLWVVWLVLPHASWLDREDLPYLAVVRGDLERLVAAEDSFKTAHGRFTASLDSLDFQETPQVTLELTAVGDSGFAAQGSHEMAQGRCAVFEGRARAPMRSMTAGQIVCR